VIEEGMERLRPPPLPGAVPIEPTWNDLVKEIASQENLKKIILDPTHRDELLQATALLYQRGTADLTKEGAANWPKLLNRLVKENTNGTLETRFDDVFALFKADTAEGAKSLSKSLESFTDGNGKLWIKEIDGMQDKAYRYVTQFDLDQIASNSGKLPLHATREGQYVTLNGAFSGGQAAKSSLQLPRPAEEYIGRIEFDILPVKDKFRVPNANNDTLPYFEPLARDNPLLGTPGGGGQLLLDGAEPNVTFQEFGTY